MSEWGERLSTSMRHSQTLRLLTIAFLVLLLLIPVGMILGLVAERQERQAAAVEEVSAKWGRAQTIAGPYLDVPYTVEVLEPQPDGGSILRRVGRHAVFLADSLATRAVIQTEERSRGIFSVPVYKLDLVATGRFSRPDFAVLGIQPLSVDWDRVQLVVGISDTRAIQKRSSVTWNELQVPLMPGSGTYSATRPGIHAVVGFADRSPYIDFSLPISLNGSQGVYFVPFGESSIVQLETNYPHSSFQGNWLPVERNISSQGFDAEWSIPFLGRNFPQAWTESDKVDLAEIVENSRFGVEFVNPVNRYSMAERSVKYAALFILLTFATLWLFEVRADVRVHPIQFLMLGGALCLFYLLLLSLSEHLSFLTTYVIASVAVIAMVASYGLIVLGALSRALAIGAFVAMLYGFLYVLLVNEDYALLIGSIGLFLILAVIMYATRNVDWYSVGSKPGS